MDVYMVAITAVITGFISWSINRHSHAIAKRLAYRRVVNNPRIALGVEFMGLFTEGHERPLIPRCVLECFTKDDMVFRVTEAGHQLEGTSIAITVIEFEKLHPFILDQTPSSNRHGQPWGG